MPSWVRKLDFVGNSMHRAIGDLRRWKLTLELSMETLVDADEKPSIWPRFFSFVTQFYSGTFTSATKKLR
jgi:hypothetical protein